MDCCSMPATTVTATTRAQRQQAIQKRMLSNRNWLGKASVKQEQCNIF